MMGREARVFAPLPPVSLEDLVPADHFYRHLERTLDLGFVHDLVHDTCAETDRLREGNARAKVLDPTLGRFELLEPRGPDGLVADEAARRVYFGEDLV